MNTQLLLWTSRVVGLVVCLFLAALALDAVKRASVRSSFICDPWLSLLVVDTDIRS
jgi:hypothetical protein